MKTTNSRLLLFFLTMPLWVFAQDESLDKVMIKKIQKEESQNSKVMDIVFHLTDVNGPRLTNSPGYTHAANYAKNQFAEWGLTDAVLDSFGEFGKGWNLERSYIAMTAPFYKPLIGLPRAWTSGTNGLQKADVLLISAKDITELKNYRGKLAGKVLMIDQSFGYQPSFKADAVRYNDSELLQMETAKPEAKKELGTTAEVKLQQATTTIVRSYPATVLSLLKEMAREEGAIAILEFNYNSHDGTFSVGGGGSFKGADPENFPDIVLAVEDYMTMLRLLKANIPVKMDMDVKTIFDTKDLQGYNVIAEIKGTDENLQDEVVMMGAHLDSWHGSMGATDNAAGVAVMMEAARILKTLGIKPKRTIRIALWGGEEQGMLGSKGYVKKTFLDTLTMKLLPAYYKLSAYYNLDNGTGKIRGIYLQGNEAARPIFTKWFEPFAAVGAKTVTINNTCCTDHVIFSQIGIPGFQFIQDPIDYFTRTHHTNVDSYDHVIADDLKTSAVIIAAIVYHTAMRREKLPRMDAP